MILATDEFTSLCPVTGAPDFARVQIAYAPRALCVESKSLKLYLWTFREAGAFCESLSEQIAQDIRAAIDPLWVEVILTQNVRGGISIEAYARLQTE